MGSVIAHWQGSSRDRELRAELIAYLLELAEASDDKLQDEPIQRPAFLELINKERESDVVRLENIRLFDQSISGKIVVSSGLHSYENLPEAFCDRSVLITKTGDWDTLQETSLGAFHSEKDERYSLTKLPPIHLNGIVFRLYDPRGSYPGEDELSFVFVDAPDLPEIDGRIVQAFNHDQCQVYEADWIRAADWMLTTPSIHLRYYLEDWYDLLMTWIKVFYVSDLHYSRYEDLSQFADFKKAIDAVIEARGREFAKQSTFEYLMDRFEKEANHWETDIEAMAVELGSFARDFSTGTFENIETKGSPSLIAIERNYAKLFSDTSRRVYQAIRDLVGIGPDAIPWLQKALVDERLASRRADILDEIRANISKLGKPTESFIETLVRCVVDKNTIPACHVFAGRALASLGTITHDQILERMNARDDYDWKRLCEFVLDQWNSASLQVLLNRAVRHESGTVKLRACTYINEERYLVNDETRELNGVMLFDALMEQLPMCQEDIREAVIKAFVGLGKATVPRLLEACDARNVEVQSAAVTALGRMVVDPQFDGELSQIANRKTLQLVTKKLEHPDSWVRVAAAHSMRIIATVMAESQLECELMYEDSILAVRIAKAHSEYCRRTIESSPLHSKLFKLLKTKSLDMLSRRRTAAWLLVAHSQYFYTMAKLLWQGVGDCEDPYRMEYLEAIYYRSDLMENPKFRELIPRILGCTGGDPPLQILALKTLGAMKAGTEEVVTRVLVMLNSKHEDVCLAAVETLGNVGSNQVEVAYELSNLLLDENRSFAEAVCCALGKQGKSAAVFVPNILDVADRFEITAIRALNEIKTAEARNAIAEIARCSRDDDVIETADYFLKKSTNLDKSLNTFESSEENSDDN
ncbi:MAG: HEAT repeat domain-containing protein [Pirellula sp.]